VSNIAVIHRFRRRTTNTTELLVRSELRPGET